MAFRRYSRFDLRSRHQNILDRYLPKCPFCREKPNWLTNIEWQVILCDCHIMCEKCKAVIAPLGGRNALPRYLIVDVGIINKSDIIPEYIYTINNLARMADINDVNQFFDIGRMENKEGKVSLENYKMIQKDMIYGEVCNLLGREGTEQSLNIESPGRSIRFFAWNEFPASITIMFKNGRVRKKSGFGLKKINNI